MTPLNKIVSLELMKVELTREELSTVLNLLYGKWQEEFLTKEEADLFIKIREFFL